MVGLASHPVARMAPHMDQGPLALPKKLLPIQTQTQAQVWGLSLVSEVHLLTEHSPQQLSPQCLSRIFGTATVNGIQDFRFCKMSGIVTVNDGLHVFGFDPNLACLKSRSSA